MRTPDEFEARLQAFLQERSEESRALRVGEKEVSEHAAIVARYADLFTREQLSSLREAEASEPSADGRERIYRMARACESGIVAAELAPHLDALQNAELAARVEFRDEELPLRSGLGKLGTLAGYEEREELGPIVFDASATLNERRLDLFRASERLHAELSGEPDPIARTDAEKGISLRDLADALSDASARTDDAYAELRRRWLDRILGPTRAPEPPSYHAAYVLRLTALADVFVKERAEEVCVTTLADIGCDIREYPNIRTDLDDRPQKAPRPAVIASDPPSVVHLITRPLGGLQDYQDFLHEAGHALHYAGCDPALPFTFRALSRDFALTEIYSYIVQSIVREPGWHARHFGVDSHDAADYAEAAVFLDLFMLRRFLAKLRFELGFWSRFQEAGGTAAGYAEELTAATGFVYRSDRFLADMDAGFYSADYLRAWIRAAQLRTYLRSTVGDDWWCSPKTGEFLRPLFCEGLRPSSEEIATRLGYDPLDVEPLVAEVLSSATA